MKQPLELNFEREGMKKLVEDFFERSNRLYVRKAKSYFIEVEIGGTMAISRLLEEALVRHAEAIRKATC